MANEEVTDEANGSIRLRVVNNAENKSTLSTEQSSPEVSNTTATSEDLVDEVKGVESIDINLIQRRAYLLSAGIGDTNRVYNRIKGWIGLVIWIFNMIIHFGLDFYEAVFVFQVSWATCIGLFLVTLVACCYSMIKHSVPWFIKGVRKLEKDGHYPKTLKRVYFIFRFMPAVVVMFALGGAMGQFGCYASDGALKLSFSKFTSKTGIQIPMGIDVLFNILRATSLCHIFYGFCLVLLFHLSLIFMIQSSMGEFNDRMGKLFRENPIEIAFPQAVNLFSARAKFVREGSQKSAVVLTTLLVACSTSFVLNAYNYLFLKRLAIYVWFALVPLIWVVCPLTGAAWVTKTYRMYKLVVVNAWVDIPEEHEIDVHAHDRLHQLHSTKGSRSPSPQRTRWGETIKQMVKHKAGALQNHGFKADDSKPNVQTESKQQPHSRKSSEISLHLSTDDDRLSKLKRGSMQGSTLGTTPEILLTDCDEVTENFVSSQTLQPGILKISTSESSLTDIENVDRSLSLEKQEPGQSGSPSSATVADETSPCHVVRIDIEGPLSVDTDQPAHDTQGSSAVPDETSTSVDEFPNRRDETEDRGIPETEQLKVSPASETSARDGNDRRGSKVNFLTGMAKTFHQWRTKTKKKRKFNYEKYIIYLESILPTVGFSIGGVIITFNGIYTFIVVLTFLVGVFAQEAFFGN